MLYVAVFLLCATGAANGLPFVDECPKTDSMQNFDIKKFSGVWYEIQRSWYLPTVTTKCHKEAYKVDTMKNEIQIKAEFLTKKTNETLFTEGRAAFNSKSSGTWRYSFPRTHAKGTLKVLNTDYDNFAILYTCQTFDIFTVELIWAVTRNRPTTSQQVQLSYNISNYVENSNYIVYIDQYNCDDSSDDATT